ncbi:MAG TPA: hypothetical protein VK476_07585 [Flavobacterium sp.]|nr:hypothetical protein [Flavobacterium sp.]
MVIEIDDPDGWDTNLKLLLTENFDILFKHSEREIQIDLMPSTDRWTAVNEYAVKRSRVVSSIEFEIKNCRLIGYHCTRLTDNEVQKIKRDGLSPLSQDLIRTRIANLLAEKQIDENLAQHLTSHNDSNHQYRKGRVWFVCGKSTLKDSSSVIRLFQSWGGEALFSSHVNDPSSSKRLRVLGKAHVITAILNPSDLRLFVNLSHKIEEAFLASRGVRTSNKPQFNTYSEKPILPKQLIEITPFGSSKFHELTNYRNWTDHLT